jgi:hypothetical protein
MKAKDLLERLETVGVAAVTILIPAGLLAGSLWLDKYMKPDKGFEKDSLNQTSFSYSSATNTYHAIK